MSHRAGKKKTHKKNICPEHGCRMRPSEQNTTTGCNVRTNTYTCPQCLALSTQRQFELEQKREQEAQKQTEQGIEQIIDNTA